MFHFNWKLHGAPHWGKNQRSGESESRCLAGSKNDEFQWANIPIEGRTSLQDDIGVGLQLDGPIYFLETTEQRQSQVDISFVDLNNQSRILRTSKYEQYKQKLQKPGDLNRKH